MPYVLEWNSEACQERFRKMANAFGLDTQGLSDEECVTKVVAAVRDLEKRLEVPMHLKELNVKESDFEVMAEKALQDPCTSGNPRKVTKEDIIALFKKGILKEGVNKIC